MRNAALIKALVHRREAIGEWLQTHAHDTCEAQAHLDEGSAERGYWTHGYQAALGDVIELIAAQASSSVGRTSH